MYASRVPKKCLNVLAKLGLCQSYSSIIKQVGTLAADAKLTIRQVVKDDARSRGLLYDNINYMERVKHQSGVHRSVFQSAVVGNIVMLDNAVRQASGNQPQCTEEVYRKSWGREWLDLLGRRDVFVMRLLNYTGIIKMMLRDICLSP